MQSQEKRGKLIVKDGYFICPFCRPTQPKLLRVDPATTARRLRVYCRKCKNEFIVDIDDGQCFESQC